MLGTPTISLDTNVVILGLRGLDRWTGIVLRNLYQFAVRLPAQVEQEVRDNLNPGEFRDFHRLIQELPTLSIVYQRPAEEFVDHYRELGLKTGDALIAAFCEEHEIEVLISENRHFLQRLPQAPFEVVDSETWCQRSGLGQ